LSRQSGSCLATSYWQTGIACGLPEELPREKVRKSMDATSRSPATVRPTVATGVVRADRAGCLGTWDCPPFGGHWTRTVKNGVRRTDTYTYVERNPLRAGLVGRAEEWPWSSLPLWHKPPFVALVGRRSGAPTARLASAGASRTDRGRLGGRAAERAAGYSVWVRRLGRADGKGVGPGIESAPWRASAPGRVVGTRAWGTFR
jgi:hypothetical protein